MGRDGERWGEMRRDGERWGEMGRFEWEIGICFDGIYFFDGISSDFGYDVIYQQQDHMGLSWFVPSNGENLLPQIWPV